MCNRIILYHGTKHEWQYDDKFDISMSRDDTDFGKGMYLTADYEMACRWAAMKPYGNNVLTLELPEDYLGYSVYSFGADIEWLNFIEQNRSKKHFLEKYQDYDILIGPTADDKLYDTLDDYFEMRIPSFQAIKEINIAQFSNQIVLKSKRALDLFKIVDIKKLNTHEIKYYRKQNRRIKRESEINRQRSREEYYQDAEKLYKHFQNHDSDNKKEPERKDNPNDN